MKADIKIEKNVPMKRHTSFKVGGVADYFAKPSSLEEFMLLIKNFGEAKFSHGTLSNLDGKNGLNENRMPCTIIGGGTNLLVRDNGIRGLVISLGYMKNEIQIVKDFHNVRENMTISKLIEFDQKADEISCEEIKYGEQVKVSASAGTNLSTLCRKTIKLGLEDLSFAAGIPGTVGGAVMMNAGTGLGTISNYLTSIDILDRDNNIKTLDKSELIFSHRKLEFKNLDLSDSMDSIGSNYSNFYSNLSCKFSNFSHKDNFPIKPIILRASFLLTKGSREKVEHSWRTLIEKRRASQPHGFPSAGCFFKNPINNNLCSVDIEQTPLNPHTMLSLSRLSSETKLSSKTQISTNQTTISAGQLIDMAGLKKRRVGDAMVSDKHANFILNLGNATASEIITLKDIVKESVFEKFGIMLSEEVIIQGE
ncbi:MAG: FAD-binding protein [Desulfamplus sp.]|nr:FAD-binding protein [Desulfamplus sp.]